MEPYLPVTSQCARFCLSATTVLFWVRRCCVLMQEFCPPPPPPPPRWRRPSRLSFPPQISLIVACIIGVIAYRLAVYAAFASIIKDPMRKIQLVGRFITPQLATSVTASCINFVIIMILNFFYERVAIWITDMGKADPGPVGEG